MFLCLTKSHNVYIFYNEFKYNVDFEIMGKTRNCHNHGEDVGWSCKRVSNLNQQKYMQHIISDVSAC